LSKVAQFGDDEGAPGTDEIVSDGDLRPLYPAIEIYRVQPAAESGPYTVALSDVPRIQGGPEAAVGASLLLDDARAAGLDASRVVATDTPRDRETNYGQVDDHSSGLRWPGQARQTLNAAADYAVGGPRVEGRWRGGSITTSDSAAQANAFGGAWPGALAASMVDGDPTTSWLSDPATSARGQWVRVELDEPVRQAMLTITTSPDAIGSPTARVSISTEGGSVSAATEPGKPVTVPLPGGQTSWVRIVADYSANGNAGSQFGIAELAITEHSTGAARPVRLGFDTVLPPTPEGTAVSGWVFTQELPGRAECVDAGDAVRCGVRGVPAEEAGRFQRTLDVPEAAEVPVALTVRGRPGPALAELLRQPGAVWAEGKADYSDPRGSAAAAVDGDPRTSWTAPAGTIFDDGPSATITLTLPEPAEVAALAITNSARITPAAPTALTVRLGEGKRQTARVGADGVARLDPATTDTITVTIAETREVFSSARFGRPEQEPGGFAEIAVLDASGSQLFAPSGPDRVVEIPCGAGPTMRIAGTDVPTTLTATAGELLSGAVVQARTCGVEAVRLPAGSADVSVSPGAALSVADVVLGERAGLAAQTFVPVGEWGAARREVQVDAGADQLLVVPESINPGWRAAGPDGAELKAVAVSGWQQGWVVPAGTSGTVTLSFPADSWYRGAVFGGLALLIPLFAAAAVRGKPSRIGAAREPRMWGASAAAAVLALFAIGGPIGAAVLLIVAGGAAWLLGRKGSRFTAQTLVALTGTAAGVGFAALSTGPWRSAAGYAGYSWEVQLPMLVALAALAVAVTPVPRWLIQRFATLRQGSSTSA
jgi:arabinofuranan 3-O-arabinosyltransferase